MFQKWMSLLLAIMLMALALPAPAEEGHRTITDMMGRTATLAEPVTRVVALSAADCEILCALGAEKLLVGRGTYCDYPSGIVDVPAVDSGAGTNVEQIVALRPQAVLMPTMAQQVEQVEALEKAGIAVVVSCATDLAGVYEAISIIGALADRKSEAEGMIADMQAVFADIADRSANTGKSIYFEVSPLQWGLWTAGEGTFMDELATICGLTNAFADVNGWAEISEEQVLLRDPDYIVTLTAYAGEGQTPEQEIAARAGWSGLRAVRNNAILRAASDEITRPGPRLASAAEALYAFVVQTENGQSESSQQ